MHQIIEFPWVHFFDFSFDIPVVHSVVGIMAGIMFSFVLLEELADVTFEFLLSFAHKVPSPALFAKLIGKQFTRR